MSLMNGLHGWHGWYDGVKVGFFGPIFLWPFMNLNNLKGCK